MTVGFHGLVKECLRNDRSHRIVKAAAVSDCYGSTLRNVNGSKLQGMIRKERARQGVDDRIRIDLHAPIPDLQNAPIGEF